MICECYGKCGELIVAYSRAELLRYHADLDR